MTGRRAALDELDLALLRAMHRHPRAGALELSRHLCVARATVQARLRRLEDSGVIAGYAPQIDLAAAGFGVLAFVTLEIAQGALDTVQGELEKIPGVLEAFATSGSGDMLCRVAAVSHGGLQEVLIQLNRSSAVARSTSVIVLSEVVPFRSMPLLESLNPQRSSKAPAYQQASSRRS